MQFAKNSLGAEVGLLVCEHNSLSGGTASFASSLELVHLLIFAPRFQHLSKLQHALSDLSPWPALKGLPLLDTVLRNMVGQDLRFVQGKPALLFFVTHCEQVEVFLCPAGEIIKFGAEFC